MYKCYNDNNMFKYHIFYLRLEYYIFLKAKFVLLLENNKNCSIKNVLNQFI